MTWLCLFDVDGTLVLTGGAGRRAMDRAFAEVLGVPEASDGLRMDGMTDPLIVQAVCDRRLGRPATAAELERVFAVYLVRLEEEVARTDDYQVMPGVVAALDHLAARGATVGLATGNLEAGARIKLERGRLWERFPFGGFGSDAADRTELVARAIERGERQAGRRFAPAAVLVLGDTPRDVAAAHGCGACAVAVATGWHTRAALAAAGADVVLGTLEELPAWLASGATPRGG